MKPAFESPYPENFLNFSYRRGFICRRKLNSNLFPSLTTEPCVYTIKTQPKMAQVNKILLFIIIIL